MQAAFTPGPKQKAWSGAELTFIRFCFDTARNLLILGLLIFFYAKTHSTFLYVSSILIFLLLVAFIWSHIEMWVVYPLYRFIDPKIPTWVMMVIHLAIVVLISAALYYTVFELAFAVAEGYAG